MTIAEKRRCIVDYCNSQEYDPKLHTCPSCKLRLAHTDCCFEGASEVKVNAYYALISSEEEFVQLQEWDKYIEYLHDWARNHKSAAYYGCSPASFDEWLDNEYTK